jgi:cytochrome c oxidase cbb3-type subunit 3
MKRLFTLALALLAPAALLRAQEAASGEAISYGYPEYEWTLAIVLLAAGIIAYAFLALFRLVRQLDGELTVAKQKLAGTYVEPEPEVVDIVVEPEQKEAAPSKIAEFFGAPKVAIADEDAITLDHDYDGIHELDNDLPPWWTALFYVTIAFGVVYLVHYHVLRTGPTSSEKYEIAMAKAEEARMERLAGAGEQLNAKTVTMLTDAGTLACSRPSATACPPKA